MGLAYGADEAMPSMPSMSVPDAIYHTVHGYPGGVAALAARMGMSANTLTHKANPATGSHYMRPDELVTIQLFGGNAAVLSAMAAALGYTVTKATPDQSGGNPVGALARAQVEFADLVRAAAEVAERLADTPGAATTGNEIRRMEYHAQEAMAAISHLLASMRGTMRPAPSEGQP